MFDDFDEEELIYTNKNRKNDMIIPQHEIFDLWYDANIVLPRIIKKYWGVQVSINAENNTEILCLFADILSIKSKIPKIYKKTFLYVYGCFEDWAFTELKMNGLRINSPYKLTNGTTILINKFHIQKKIENWESENQESLMEIFLYDFLRIDE